MYQKFPEVGPKCHGTRGGHKCHGKPYSPACLDVNLSFRGTKGHNIKGKMLRRRLCMDLYASWGHLAFFEGFERPTFASLLHSGPRTRDTPPNVLQASEEDWTSTRNDGFTKASSFLSESCGFTMARAQLFRAERGWGSAESGCLSVLALSHVRETVCQRPGGSVFFESGQRDLGVSSKAHKFACELRALLASDKHLGSAERSERQLPKLNTPASARGTVADLIATPLPPTPNR